MFSPYLITDHTVFNIFFALVFQNVVLDIWYMMKGIRNKFLKELLN